MRVTIEQTAVWRSMDDYNGNREPVAVVTSEAAAWAVFDLLNPPEIRLANGCVMRTGPFPAIGTLYSWSERPDLAEDAPVRLTNGYYNDWEQWERAEAESEAAAMRMRREGYQA